MGCVNCEDKKDNSIKIQEAITIINNSKNKIDLDIINTQYIIGIETIVKSGIKRIVEQYTVIINNYKELDLFLDKYKAPKVSVKGNVYKDSTIEKIDKDIYKIIIKK